MDGIMEIHIYTFLPPNFKRVKLFVGYYKIQCFCLLILSELSYLLVIIKFNNLGIV